MKKQILLLAITAALCFTVCGPANSAPSGGEVAAASAETSTQLQGTAQGAKPPAEARAEIKAVVSKNCNYVYHMLSVSKCGYDNAYGDKNKSFHAGKDLQVLKNNERNLTIAGGEHMGELYFLCVILPASLDDEIPLPDYFEALADLFATGEIERNFKTYQKIYEQSFSSVAEVDLDTFRMFYSENEAMKEEIAAVADVMCRNYGIYKDKVWETSLAELNVVVDGLNQEFAKIDYVAKWEELLGTRYQQDAFWAVICNSIENGAEAIDISGTKDVFSHTKEYASKARFISHEFGIYLLMDVLAGTSAFQDYSTYKLTEALAEYYNILICGGHDAGWDKGYIGFYSQLREREPEITAKEMFLRAVAHYSPAQ